ncbi:MAG: hypothetical protein WBF99_24155 [Xanthobacteraceae bacterium]
MLSEVLSELTVIKSRFLFEKPTQYSMQNSARARGPDALQQTGHHQTVLTRRSYGQSNPAREFETRPTCETPSRRQFKMETTTLALRGCEGHNDRLVGAQLLDRPDFRRFRHVRKD